MGCGIAIAHPQMWHACRQQGVADAMFTLVASTTNADEEGIPGEQLKAFIPGAGEGYAPPLFQVRVSQQFNAEAPCACVAFMMLAAMLGATPTANSRWVGAGTQAQPAGLW